MSAQLDYPREPIAIIGSSCRFPGGASSPSGLWDLLRQPDDVLAEIPPSRFNVGKFYQPGDGMCNVRHSYVLSEDHRMFDAQFFGVKPVEAKAIDPQQRLLLEATYEALESAGLPMKTLQGSSMGVFVGLMGEEYSGVAGRDIQDVPTYFATGTARSLISNRVSYFFDFHGPSMTIDTACSSSLVALHQAVLALRDGESCGAIVAGANLLLGPEPYVAENKLKMLSPSGRSRMWDKDADGYARGDGVGVLVLKTLSQALTDQNSVECIIRETGINQDGRTKGITMPNAIAQASLIRATYAKAGLDLSKLSDRPQYFEAHGTGTATGDPIEAEAINSVFFGVQSAFQPSPNDPPLYVGSIKTVIGHSEGAAGVAAVMKVSLALQNSIIPPNLLFEELNPAVRPFYTHLQVPRKVKAWPTSHENGPRRASINSFGFGGVNAHAILESFHPFSTRPSPQRHEHVYLTPPMAPFNFSAVSAQSLSASLSAYSSYVKKNLSVSLRDLSWTLSTKRSTLPIRASVSALSVDDLAMKLENISKNSNNFVTTESSSTCPANPRLLGVFTGQGAQWATMGAGLVRSSPLVADCFDMLEKSLGTLPAIHAPTWSLKEELFKGLDSSRVGQARFSQPLCTAIQIALVNLFKAAKVDLDMVVGHSSGEIAAAYAGGYLSAGDAIRVAYYRGLCTELSGTSVSTKGAMLVIKTTYEDAQDLCELPAFEGRLCIAAISSPTSVTLSGDDDAITEAEGVMEDEKKFTRRLKVDRAYHSHHMVPCANPYLAALESCGIQVQPRPSRSDYPVWISSFVGESIDSLNLDCLKSIYWLDNMVKPVHFSKAVECAVGAHGGFDMAIEIGPHPALKGPTLETIQSMCGQAIPYIGTLVRGRADLEAFADTLGDIWKSLGDRAVDFTSFDKAIYGTHVPLPKLMKGLPTYAWTHDRFHWHETRSTKAFRANGGPSHPLLGYICPDETEGEFRFKNYLSYHKLPWLEHHQIQCQVVFPAGGYLSGVVEAVAQLYPLDTIRLIELYDISIRQALFVPENSKVEILLSLKAIENDSNSTRFVFSFYSDSGKESNAMIENASGRLRVSRGCPSGDSLPSPRVSHGQFLDLEPEMFYSFVRELGYGYDGPFRGLSRTSRRLNEATGLLEIPEYRNKDSSPFALHPATLDCAIQTVLLAYCYPGDGRLRSLHLPTRIDRLCIDLSACLGYACQPGAKLPFYSSVVPHELEAVIGDVEVYSVDRDRTIIQIEGLHAVALMPVSAVQDAKIFSEMTWSPEEPMAVTIRWEEEKYATEITLSFLLERVAYFYLRKLGQAFPRNKRDGLQWRHTRLLDYVDHCLAQVATGRHPYASEAWIRDSEDHIESIVQQYSPSVDVKIMKSIGENLSWIGLREINPLEQMRRDSMLSDYYAHALGVSPYVRAMSSIVKQLSHRFAHMNIIEIGAGTGNVAMSILKGLEGAFRTYTYTDISNSFFQELQERFAQFQSKMIFKILNIEKPIAHQEYLEGSYDVVVAAFVLQTTGNLKETMINIRRLLRPGGYVVLLEITDNNVLRFGLTLGSLSRSWAGHEGERKLPAYVSPEVWRQLMRETGFSDINAITPQPHALPIPFFTIVYQAIDSQVQFLREPLAQSTDPLGLKSLTIIGGRELSENLCIAVRKHYSNITRITFLEDLVLTNLPFLGSVVILVDLEKTSTFQAMTEAKLQALQALVKQSKIILWVTTGCRYENPYKNMFLGFQRTIALETAHVRFQFMDFALRDEIDYAIIAKKILELEALGIWHDEKQPQDLLWHCEPEIYIQDKRVFIPRLRLSDARNRRYNSSRKFLAHDVTQRNTNISIRCYNSQISLEESKKMAPPNQIEIRLTHSLLRPVHITKTSTAFLSVGEVVETQERVIALSDTLASCIYAPAGWHLRGPQCPETALKALMLLFIQLLARKILMMSAQGEFLVVLNPAHLLGEALSELAKERGLQLMLITTKDKNCTRPSLFVHPQARKASIQKLLPANVSMFINMDGESRISNLVQSCLPSKCQRSSFSSMTAAEAQLDQSTRNTRQISDKLQQVWSTCSTTNIATVDLHSMPKLVLSDVTRGTIPPAQAQAILSWDRRNPVPVQLKPASRQVCFTPNKTYWLVGLTGGLGLSLCQWMVELGARHIALSSRTPRIEHEWLRGVTSQGCSLRIIPCDVADRQSVRKAHTEIAQTMPPIAGVAQGAMVLRDTIFPELNLEQLDHVFGPKVQGSVWLDEIFSADTLDFFIFFSSIAYVAGNAGQSTYAAANAFMASLVANRRKRGLAGSVINIGAIVGNGYVSQRMERSKQLALRRAGFSFMSEQDFFETFAEGVLSARPEASGGFEISTGLRLEKDNDESPDQTWASNPIFQHLVTATGGLVAGNVRGRSSSTVRADLLEATSHEQVFKALKDNFLVKLRATLQADFDNPLRLSPDELGVDSLIAVDFQSWFHKELRIDVSLLKILNTSSIQNLLCEVEELLPSDMVPNLNGSNSLTKPSELASLSSAIQRDESAETRTQPAARSAESVADNSSSSHHDFDHISDMDNESSGKGLTSSSPLPMTTKRTMNSGASSKKLAAFERSVPMSFAQSGFWFLRSFVEDQTAFNVTTIIKLRGRINIGKFEKALADLGQRHDALRTTFYTDQTTRRHMQGIASTSVLRLEHSTVSNWEQIQDAIQEMQRHIFDLSNGEVLRLKILSLADDFHYIVLGYHHIAVDGIGLRIIASDLEKAYNGTLDITGRDTLQYPDFTLRQVKECTEGSWQESIAYWRDQFSTLPPPLPLLSLSRRLGRPDGLTFASYSVRFRLSAALKKQIKRCCRRFNATAFHFYLAAFRILLIRYTNNATKDITIGVADGNRKDADVLESLGLFLNLIPLRFRHDSNEMFTTTLETTRATSNDGFANSRVPFDFLLGELKLPRSPSHSPLFQAFINYRQNVQETWSFCGCEAEGESVSVGQNAYDVSLDITDSSNRENLIAVSVNRSLFTAQDAELLKQSYLSLLEAFAQNPAAQILWPSLHLERHVKGTMFLGQGTECISQWPPTIVERIDDMVERYGNKIAIKDGVNQAFTYTQMAKRACQLASILLDQGIDSGSRVGICQMPGTDWICSLLAVLRTGAAAVALDLRVGLDRLLLIVKDCIPKIILVDSVTNANVCFPDDMGTIVMDVSEFSTGSETDIVPSRAEPSDTAIISYTSGSTGAPKGVMLKHASYANFVEFAPPRWNFQAEKETVLQQSSYAFDMSLCQIFLGLGYGATLVIPDDTSRHDPARICDLIVASGITFTLGTPTEYSAWLRHGPGKMLSKSQWRGAVSGGEPVTASLFHAFRSLKKADLQLINCYGPAEATFACADRVISYQEPDDDDDDASNFTLSPMANHVIHIVDENMNSVPAGVPGQIAIGGAGVAIGYLSQQERRASTTTTTAAFIPNRQLTSSSFFEKQGWTTLHLSGDRGRLTAAEGHLMLEGRIEGRSTQVKIGGIRIEVEEIENAIVRAGSPHVRQAVVSLRESSQEEEEERSSETTQFLVAFVTLHHTSPPADQGEFLTQLPRKLPLPQYMRPSMVLALDSFPRTVSGKLDRSAINSMSLPHRTHSHSIRNVSGLSDFERTLRHLWQEALPREVAGHHTIDQETDFFHAGGTSLSLMNLQALIKDRLKIETPVYRLFSETTLRGMATVLQSQQKKFEEEEQPSHIDWHQQTQFPTYLAELADSPDPKLTTSPPSVVILTGATGFLGQSILQTLIPNPQITKIHCLAVRRPISDLPSCFTHPKITVHPGDLTQPDLGLSPLDTQTIFTPSPSSVLIHAAADTSFLKAYPTLHPVNVASTKSLVSLALPHRIPFHFISSATVSRLTGQEAFSPASVAPHPPSPTTSDGYTSSKWVCEAYLERVSRAFGLPVVIHRPSSITGQAASETDLLRNVVEHARRTRSVPDWKGWRGWLDFVAVETVAEAIGNEIMNPEGGGEGVRFVHEVGDVEIELGELQGAVEDGTGEEFTVLDVGKWIEGVVQAGMHPLLGEYLRRIAGESIVLPRLVKGTGWAA